MKKRLLCAAFAGTLLVAVLITGCDTKTIENEYIKIEDMSDLKVDDMEQVLVTDEDVDAYIDEIAEYYAEKIETNEPAAMGDTVDFSYTSSFNGEILDFASDEAGSFTINVEDEHYGTGFLQNLVGHNAGESFTGEYIMTGYSLDPAYLYQTINCQYNILKVYKNVKPEITDDFIKEHVEGYTNVADYKAYLKEQMQADNDEYLKELKRNDLWEQIKEKTTVKKYPEQDIKNLEEFFKHTYEEHAKELNMEYEDFVRIETSKTIDEFNKEISTYARKFVEEQMIVEAIAKKENIKVSDDELEEFLIDYADGLGYEDIDEMKEYFAKNLDENYLYYYALREKVWDYLVDKYK